METTRQLRAEQILWGIAARHLEEAEACLELLEGVGWQRGGGAASG